MLLTDSLSCYSRERERRRVQGDVGASQGFKGRRKKNFDQVSIDQSMLINVINNTPSVISLEEGDLYSIQPL